MSEEEEKPKLTREEVEAKIKEALVEKFGGDPDAVRFMEAPTFEARIEMALMEVDEAAHEALAMVNESESMTDEEQKEIQDKVVDVIGETCQGMGTKGFFASMMFAYYALQMVKHWHEHNLKLTSEKIGDNTIVQDDSGQIH